MSSTKPHSINDLLYLMSRLRDVKDGCPWDLKQTYQTIASCTIEEAYEVVDAIEKRDYAHLTEELGDLLFQVIFYSQLGKEDKLFDFHEVVHLVTEKLIRRHPHVFPGGYLQSRRGDEDVNEAEINANWETIKQSERTDKGRESVLDDVPVSLPAITRAHKLQKRAAKVGFDWHQLEGVFDKIDEEITELKEALEADNKKNVQEEFGDLLFTCVNLGRSLGLDSETALRLANTKFENRFRKMEEAVQDDGVNFGDANIDQLEAYWKKVKAEKI